MYQVDHNIQLKGQGRSAINEISRGELEAVYEEIRVMERKLKEAYEEN